MAARTRRVRFSSDVCLLPFSHPIRLAEDLAMLDNISGGQVEIGVGLGCAVNELRHRRTCCAAGRAVSLERDERELTPGLSGI